MKTHLSDRTYELTNARRQYRWPSLPHLFITTYTFVNPERQARKAVRRPVQMSGRQWRKYRKAQSHLARVRPQHPHEGP